jgi:hypothetical protein
MNSNAQKKETPEQAAARKAASIHRNAAEAAAKATLQSESSTFGARNRANIVLKRLRKGQTIH